MNIISISDDDLNYKTSKWVLEELLHLDCNSFSFLIKPVKCVTAKKSQEILLAELTYFSQGEAELETLFYSQNSNPWLSNLKKYAFNRDTIAIILNHMGRNLLDWDAHFNKGIYNWQFYSDSKLIGGANVDDDCFMVFSSGEGLISKLTQMAIPYTVT